MEIVHTHCGGLDVHKKTVVATVIVPDRQGGLQKETRTFETMTVDLLALSDWLLHYAVTHVEMESTGEYWKPIYNILEDNFEVLLVNAQHVKQVPGRKTDVKDSEWLAELLRHGLLKGSFIPPLGQRELRELTRHRTALWPTSHMRPDSRKRFTVPGSLSKETESTIACPSVSSKEGSAACRHSCSCA